MTRFARPWTEFGRYAERQRAEGNIGIGIVKMQARWKLTMLECERDLDQAGNSGRGLEMADVGFDRADGARTPGRTIKGEHRAERLRFDRITEEGAGAMRFDVLHAAGHDPRIKAVVSVSGAYSPRIPPSKKLPPLLILHGSKDKSTPVDFVKKYQEALKEQEMPHAVHIYPGSGHNFDTARFEDATRRSIAFFDRYVRTPGRGR